MPNWNPCAEEEKAVATATECALRLWRAQEDARNAAETLRRAVRSVEEAGYALADATRRRDRIGTTTARAIRDDQTRRLELLR